MQTHSRTPSAASWRARRARARRRSSTRRPASSRRSCRCRPRPSSTPPSPPPSWRCPAWAETPPLKRARYMFRFKELLDAEHRPDRRGDLGRARQDPRRRRRRGAARHRGRRFRLRHPASPEGRVLPPRRPGDRHPFRPPAARRLRRHHAVQLPGDGADVDVSGGDRLRQHLRPEAVGEATRRRSMVVYELFTRGRLPGGRAQRRPRRQGSGRRDPRPIPTSRR